MPLDPSIPLGVQQPQPMQALSSVLNIANQSQQLQNAQLANQQGQQGLQSGAIDLQEKQRVQSVLSNPANYLNSDGSLNQQALIRNVMQVAPVNGARYIQGIASSHQQVTSALQAVNSLDSDSRTKAAEIIGGTQGMSPADREAALDAAEQKYPALAKPLDLFRQHLIAPALKSGDPNQLNAAFNNVAKIVQPTNVQLGMNGSEDVQSDAQGNRYIVRKTPTGMVAGTRPVPNASDGRVTDVPGAGPVNLPQGMTAATRDAVVAEGQAAATAASQAGTMHGINDEIWKLAGEPATTNKWGQAASKLRQYTGINAAPGTTENTDTLTKLLAQQNMRLAQQMGVHTDAGSAQVAAASGEQHYSPAALRNVTNLNDGLVKGSELYAAGYDNVLRTKGPGAAAQFKIQWGQAFDPEAAAYMAAKDSGNAERISDIKQKLGVAPGKPGYSKANAQALFAKIARMHQLAGLQ